MRLGVDERVLLEHVERAREVPEVLRRAGWRRRRSRARGSTSHRYLSGGFQSAPFAEAAQVGREHDVAAHRRAGARSRRGAPRSRRGSRRRRARRPRPCRDRARAPRGPPAPGRVRSWGTSRNAGTVIVGSLSKTIDSRRYGAAVDASRAPRGRAAPGPEARRAGRRAGRGTGPASAGIAAGSPVGQGSRATSAAEPKHPVRPRREVPRPRRGRRSRALGPQAPT